MDVREKNTMKLRNVLLLIIVCVGLFCGAVWRTQLEKSGLIYYPSSGAELISMHNKALTRYASDGLEPTYKLIHTGVSDVTYYSITSGVTFEEYETIIVEPRAWIYTPSGVTPSFNPNKIIAIDTQRVFELDGGIEWTVPGEIPIDWVGVKPNIETNAVATSNLNNINKLTASISGVTGCILKATAGEYWFEASDRVYFEIRDNMHFVGQGKDDITIFNWIDFDVNNQFYSIMRNTVDDNITNVSFKDMCFDNSGVSPMNVASSSPTRGVNIRIGDAILVDPTGELKNHNITIDSCKFKSYALSMNICQAENVKIINSDFVLPESGVGNPSIDIMNGSTNVIVQGNYVEETTYLAGVNCNINLQASNLVVNGNVIDGGNTYGSAILSEGGKNIIISNNTIDQTGSLDYTITGIIIAGCTDVLINSNLMYGADGSSSAQRGISDNRDNHNLKIINNTITNYSIGIQVGSTTSTYYYTGYRIIEDNVIVDNKIKPFLANCDGSSTTYTDLELTFKGNTIIGVNNDLSFDMYEDTGKLTVMYNEGAEILLQSLSEDHETRLGYNYGGIPNYDYSYFYNLPDAQYDMIKWEGATYVVTPELDFDGGDLNFYLSGYDYNKRYLVAGIDYRHTEASSLSSGILLYLRIFDIDGLVTTLPSFTTDMSNDIRQIDHDRVDGNLSYYDVPAMFNVRCNGTATGTGAVIGTIKLIEQ